MSIRINLLLLALVVIIIGASAFKNVETLKSQRRIMCIVIAERGHFNPMLHLCMHLARRGWNVRIASQKTNAGVIAEEYPRHAASLPFVPLGESFFPGNQTEQLERRKRWVSNDMLYQWMELSRIAKEMFHALDAYLESVPDELPTLIIGDVFTFAGPMMAEKRKIPLLVNSPVLIGGLTNPLQFMNIEDMNYGQQLLSALQPGSFVSVVSHWVANSWESFEISSMDKKLTHELNQFRHTVGLPSIESSVDSYRSALLLVDSAFGFEYAFPLPPRIYHIGPLLPVEVLKSRQHDNSSLPQELSSWISRHDQIVYFSMGSVALLRDDALESILETLKDVAAILVLPKSQHVLARKFVSDPNRWRLETWAPQKHILTHPNIRLFISHCGMGGAQESLLAGVPLLCIPQFGDQYVTTYRIVAHGIGVAYLQDKNRGVEQSQFRSVFEAIWRHVDEYKLKAEHVGRLLASAGSVEAAEKFVETISAIGSVDHLVQGEYTAKRSNGCIASSLPACTLLFMSFYALYVRISDHSRISDHISDSWTFESKQKIASCRGYSPMPSKKRD